jgi:hypothetical protein
VGFTGFLAAEAAGAEAASWGMRPELNVGVMASNSTAGRSKKDFDMAVS